MRGTLKREWPQRADERCATESEPDGDWETMRQRPPAGEAGGGKEVTFPRRREEKGHTKVTNEGREPFLGTWGTEPTLKKRREKPAVGE